MSFLSFLNVSVYLLGPESPKKISSCDGLGSCTRISVFDLYFSGFAEVVPRMFTKDEPKISRKQEFGPYFRKF